MNNTSREFSGYNDFKNFFEKATGFEPYPYQQTIAKMDDFPYLIDVPTGLGKTAGIVIGWLWRRHNDSQSIREKTPMRLIYCLPMRVLVEQIRDYIIMWLDNLNLLGGTVNFEDVKGIKKVTAYNPSWDDPEKIAVTILMGGESKDLWDIYPERDAIIIGTQDMLISRALNRGYGMSRYRWPIHFGLLNNDSLWIMDEVQLMGNGLSTSVQMEAFRNDFKTIKKTQTIWMSATINSEYLRTVDFDRKFTDYNIIKLSDEDRKDEQIKKKISAPKNLKKIGKDQIIDTVINNHEGGSISIIITNTVARAKEIYNSLMKKNISAKILLIHSQFRLPERQKIIKQMMHQPLGENGTIIISTQVIEAGVNISAHTLITELAPLPSLVQRFGRCNRYGEYKDAKVFWVDILDTDKEKIELPYTKNELLNSKNILITQDIKDVSIINLSKLKIESPLPDREILRKKDIFELFDTTSNIIGENIDVSKYVRNIKDTNVQIFWRDLKDYRPADQEPLPTREELCPVPINDVKMLVDKKVDMWTWDYFDGKWVKVIDSADIFPAQQILLKATEGHYSETEGWAIDKKGPVMVIHNMADNEQQTVEGWAIDKKGPVMALKTSEDINKKKYDGDSNVSIQDSWENIAQHTDKVMEKAKSLCNKISIPDEFKDSILNAVRWHDAGKAHTCFQSMLDKSKIPQGFKPPVAKAPKNAWIKNDPNYRKHFRHELVSGLLAIKNEKSDLVAYLAASHHGKVRLSIRSMPDEEVPKDASIRFARGVWDRDVIPKTDLGKNVTVPQTTIDLSLMELGDDSISGPSWLSRTLSLCVDPKIGIFILGFLESIVREADERESGG